MPEDQFDQAWSAYQQRDGTWVVRFVYVSRKHGQRAEWVADFHEKMLIARNRLASELAYVEKGRARRGAPFLPPPEPEPAALAADDDQEGGPDPAPSTPRPPPRPPPAPR